MGCHNSQVERYICFVCNSRLGDVQLHGQFPIMLETWTKFLVAMDTYVFLAFMSPYKLNWTHKVHYWTWHCNRPSYYDIVSNCIKTTEFMYCTLWNAHCHWSCTIYNSLVLSCVVQLSRNDLWHRIYMPVVRVERKWSASESLEHIDYSFSQIHKENYK